MPHHKNPSMGVRYYCDKRNKILSLVDWSWATRSWTFRVAYPLTESERGQLHEDETGHLIEIVDDMSVLAFITEIENRNAGCEPSRLTTATRLGERLGE